MPDPLSLTAQVRVRVYCIRRYLLVATAIASCGCGTDSNVPFERVKNSTARTQAYLRKMKIESFVWNGSDYTNPKYSPLRLGKPVDQIDNVYDYDFARLAETAKELEGIDRSVVCKAIFSRVCRDCTSDLDRHLAILEFCNKASLHNSRIQPMRPSGRTVYDPLLLLELAEQRCGQTARIVVDLFEAAGYRARLVQLGCHISSEVFYDGDWHYLDAGLFGGRWTVFDTDGTIPSCAELSRMPYAIDAMPSDHEPRGSQNEPVGSAPYASWFYFSTDSYAHPPLFYVKTGTPEQHATIRDYGWQDGYLTIEDRSRSLDVTNKRFVPSAPRNLRFDSERGTVGWDASTDIDGDLLGYRVFLSSQSRGWCYGPSWTPSMYDARFRLPPSDVDLLETQRVEVLVPRVRPLYTTVMPFDKHGESVGRVLYPVSRELELLQESVLGTDASATASR